MYKKYKKVFIWISFDDTVGEGEIIVAVSRQIR